MKQSLIVEAHNVSLPNAMIVRALVRTCLLIAVAATALLGVWISADARLWELRFALSDRAPTGEVVFVDIDAQSLAEIGVWPWPRSLHGQLLDRLMALGAFEVAFDIDFSAQSTPIEDSAFAQSLERAGGYAYLAAFRQKSAQGVDIWSRPISALAAQAEEALVNVDGLRAGLIWSMPGKDATTALPSIAAHFTPDATVPDILRIDYSIDLQQIPRVSANAVLDGTADRALIENRQVIVGTSAIELHDLLMVPRFGVVPGAIVQVAAAETLKLGRPLTDIGSWPLLLFGALIILGSTMVPKLRLDKAIAIALAASALLEGVVYAAYVIWGVYVETAACHALVVTILIVRLLEERLVRRRQLRVQHERLVYLASHDDDTGALSQNAWIEVLDAGIAHRECAAALLLRVEQLDSAGASLGYRLADEAIKQFHHRLRAELGGPVARIESHVFAVGLKEVLIEDAIAGLLEQLERPHAIAGHHVAIKLRWGMASFTGEKSSATTLQEARTAVAMAERTGRQGCIFAPEFETEFERRRQIDIALRAAVDMGELDLAFQLQVDTKTREAVGVEALLRWHSKDLGSISPGEFIPMSEENGTIIALGNWVAHEACRRAVENSWTGRLSINVAPAQFTGSDVIDMIQSALDQSGFPADRLDVEITESMVSGGHQSIAKTLEGLRDMGVSIAIDDFGTGHSALSYLATLPVDKLKIDQSFVRRIDTHRGAEVIKTIAALGKGLGLPIVVEGVETEHELAVVEAIGCDIVQGYLFGKPGPFPVSQSLRVEAA